MGPHLGGRGGGDGKHSSHPLARLLSSSGSAICEIVMWHPIDTATKRIITHPERLLTANGLSLEAKIGRMHRVVFREKTNARPLQKFKSLFPGERVSGAGAVPRRPL